MNQIYTDQNLQALDNLAKYMPSKVMKLFTSTLAHKRPCWQDKMPKKGALSEVEQGNSCVLCADLFALGGGKGIIFPLKAVN